MTGRISIPALRDIASDTTDTIWADSLTRPDILALVEAVEAARVVVDASFGEIDEIDALAAALARFDFEEEA